MSFRAANRVVLCAALFVTVGCGGGRARSPHAALSPDLEPSAIRFEDLPVTRLPRDRVPLANAANPSLGPERAPVIVQLWSDFECPYCADEHPVLVELLRVYPGKVRLVWRDYPLPTHAHARLAANAGREAYAQGGAALFWKFHDAIYESSDAELDERTLEQFALRAGLDQPRFHDAQQRALHEAEIARDVLAGDAIGVTGTPAFLINDYFFVGAVPLEILRVVVDRALSEASPEAATH